MMNEPGPYIRHKKTNPKVGIFISGGPTRT